MARTPSPARETRALPDHPVRNVVKAGNSRVLRELPLFTDHFLPAFAGLRRGRLITDHWESGFHGGVGRGCGVGRGRGVALGVAVGVALGVTLGVTVGVDVGVALGVIVGVAVGVGVSVGVGVGVAPPGQVYVREPGPGGLASQKSWVKTPAAPCTPETYS